MNLPLYREAPPFVDTLAKLSGEDVHLCIFDGAQMVFVTGQNKRPFDCVLQLANVARPRMLPQKGNRGQRDFLAGNARLGGQRVQKIFRERNDVFFSLT